MIIISTVMAISTTMTISTMMVASRSDQRKETYRVIETIFNLLVYNIQLLVR